METTEECKKTEASRRGRQRRERITRSEMICRDEHRGKKGKQQYIKFIEAEPEGAEDKNKGESKLM